MSDTKTYDKASDNSDEKKQNPTNNSITKVNFSDYQASRYFANRRVVCSFRCDEGLWLRAKPILKRVYGSICRGIEVYLANFIEATERGVYFSHTEKPINIDKIVIERNLRSRRKMVVEEDEEEVETVKVLSCGFCHKNPAIAVYEDVVSGIRKYACRFHGNILKVHEKWRLVREVSPLRRQAESEDTRQEVS